MLVMEKRSTTALMISWVVSASLLAFAG